MKYVMLAYGTQEDWDAVKDLPQEVAGAEYGPADDVAQELIESGEFVYAAGLSDPTHATAVEIRDGSPVVTDGPFPEAKEYLVSFGIVDVASHDRALEIAARMAKTFQSRIELRPIEGDGAPDM
jgi:hypothetical protein